MVMPSGRRSSEPGPEPNTSGSAPSSAASVVIRIGRKRSMQASKIACSGFEPALALGVEREVDHDDAVLLHDADQQDDPDQRDQRQVGPEHLQRQQRAEPGRRQRRDDRQRMREALVEHAKHDIDRNQRGQDQQRLRADRLAVGAGVALEFGAHRVRHVQLGDRAIDRARRLVDGDVRRQAEADRHRRELALVVDHQRLQARARPWSPRRAAPARHWRPAHRSRSRSVGSRWYCGSISRITR